jgi:uncharacterized protein YcbK (DUF882 family)
MYQAAKLKTQNLKLMKKNNYKITDNFSLYQYMEGVSMPKQAIELAWKHFTAENEAAIKAFMPELETILSRVKELFGTDKGIRITAGFRPVAWEKLKGRDGTSQHTIVAIDFDLTGFETIEKQAAAIAILYRELDKTWTGGLAIKKPSKGKSGFIHIDPRKAKARWNY